MVSIKYSIDWLSGDHELLVTRRAKMFAKTSKYRQLWKFLNIQNSLASDMKDHPKGRLKYIDHGDNVIDDVTGWLQIRPFISLCVCK